jgi:hypothetical protein
LRTPKALPPVDVQVPGKIPNRQRQLIANLADDDWLRHVRSSVAMIHSGAGARCEAYLTGGA